MHWDARSSDILEDKGAFAVNRETDTCFGNGLVMGSADCLYYAGLVKTQKKVVLRVNLALYQTHCKQVPVFSHLCKYHVIKWSKSTLCVGNA